MRVLPAALSTVVVPTHVSPSALGLTGGCVLKLAAASRGATNVERLDVGPELSIGVFTHRVIEAVENGDTRQPSDAFDEEYTKFHDELSKDSRRAHFADLASTKTRADWMSLRARVISRCERTARGRSGARSSTAGNGGAGGNRDVGAEVPLESSALRLRGNADRVSKLGPNEFEVQDFKSGRALDDEGSIKSHIRLQLLAYGLMVAETHTNARVRLVVDDGEDHDIPFGKSERDVARREVLAITSTLPPAGPRDIDGLARPGEGCWGCSIRHVCPAYRRAAPTWWNRYPDSVDHVSKDVWGHLVDVRPSRVAGLTDIVMTDVAGRRVRVERLDSRHSFEALKVGDGVWMFDLEATGGGRDFDGHRFLPRGLHEHPRDRRERTAWRLQVYRNT